MTTIVVTGAEGFIGRNLVLRLRELGNMEILPVGRQSEASHVAEALSRADFVYHLAGVNRPTDPAEFSEGNAGFTRTICAGLEAACNKAPILYTSSTSATDDNAYGNSKREAEEILQDHAVRTGAPLYIFRLPNVFGKWARPNYNSAVATFCYNIARGLPISIHDPSAPLRLVYIDDVIDAFTEKLEGDGERTGFNDVAVVYETTVGDVAAIIASFPQSRETLVTANVGTGLVRALYATYLSYLEPSEFSYLVPVHGSNDPRGIFIEMLKTPEAGQFSYFIAHPGVTRGDHYHHSKTEKFLVIKGKAHFAFRQVDTGECHEIVVDGGQGRIVETVPGWTHNITNVGDEDLICMLWANENFDPQKPDTIGMKVTQ